MTKRCMEQDPRETTGKKGSSAIEPRSPWLGAAAGGGGPTGLCRGVRGAAARCGLALGSPGVRPAQDSGAAGGAKAAGAVATGVGAATASAPLDEALPAFFLWRRRRSEDDVLLLQLLVLLLERRRRLRSLWRFRPFFRSSPTCTVSCMSPCLILPTAPSSERPRDH